MQIVPAEQLGMSDIVTVSYTHLSLSVGTGWNKQILPDHANHSLTAAVEASWNLFDGNITAAKIKDAELSLEQAELEYYKQRCV